MIAREAVRPDAVPESIGCPHVDANDPRCANRFSLGRIEQAFGVCFGSFHACPTFRRIRAEQERAACVVEITVAGGCVARELRPTGS